MSITEPRTPSPAEPPPQPGAPAAPDDLDGTDGSEGLGGYKSAAPAPRTVEQLVNAAGSAEGLGLATRVARGHGLEVRGLAHVPLSRLHEGRFGRMFRLSPFVPDRQRIVEIAALMAEGAKRRGDSLDNPAIPAGYTYLGQFIDHDLTFDPVSSLARQNDPDALTNFRSPRLDLDCVYGRGPADDPFLYDKRPGRADMMLLGRHDGADDLPRNSQGTALLGDPRNDENILVGQLQLTMLKFHNRVVQHVRDNPERKRGSETTFEAAQRIVRWHYQWMVVHDFLRRVVGPNMLADVFDETGRRPFVRLEHFKPKTANVFMPVEFAVAAYRFGHSLIRPRYKLNSLVGPLPTFKPGSVQDDPLGHFGGFRTLPALWTIEWARFFEVDGAGRNQLQQARLIDSRLADPLKTLPVEIGGDRPSLIERNLIRGARLLLPSGQDVAEAMGADKLSRAELNLPGGGPAPLWYYVLREARVQTRGRHLGQVGGRIVAEVLLGLLSRDPASYLRLQPRWKPFLPSARPDEFTMPDLITFTGHGLERTG